MEERERVDAHDAVNDDTSVPLPVPTRHGTPSSRLTIAA
jgi:hypothetical protein